MSAEDAEAPVAVENADQQLLDTEGGAGTDDFFRESAPPANLADTKKALEKFLKRYRHKPVIVVTSGGTTVPLEKKTVRFIDNFSSGTRGSCRGRKPLLNAKVYFIRHVVLEV